MFELIRHEDCDVNEVDTETGRSPLLYAAMSHNFQVIRDLQQFDDIDLKVVDVNGYGVTYFLDHVVEDDNGFAAIAGINDQL